MAEMSRIHEALGVTQAPRTSHTGVRGLGQLGWAPGSRTTRRRERRGLGDYLLRGILIGGLAWIGWWMAISRDEPVDVEPAVATGAVGAAPAEAPVEPVVLPVETPGASNVSADAPSVSEGELRPGRDAGADRSPRRGGDPACRRTAGTGASRHQRDSAIRGSTACGR